MPNSFNVQKKKLGLLVVFVVTMRLQLLDTGLVGTHFSISSSIIVTLEKGLPRCLRFEDTFLGLLTNVTLIENGSQTPPVRKRRVSLWLSPAV